MKEFSMGTKASVTTIAIKAGLVCPVDGQIFTDDLMRDLTKLLKEKGYSMKPAAAYKKVMAFAEIRDWMTYGN